MMFEEGSQVDSNPWAALQGPNLGYIIEQYEHFLNNKEIDLDLQEKFHLWGSPIIPTNTNQSATDTKEVFQIMKRLENIRRNGHLVANLNPLQKPIKNTDFNSFTSTSIAIHDFLPDFPLEIQSIQDAFTHLNKTYTDTISFEFEHTDESSWLYKLVESSTALPSLTKEDKINLLYQLAEVEQFEHFLHKTFVGQKRFSIEGLDVLVPMLNSLIKKASQIQTKHVSIGMAHRGRLSVLANVLRKPYQYMLAEFQHVHMDNTKQTGWTGDVKYHLGWDLQYSEHTTVTLANNPSHLEFINPIVEGMTRAVQENRTDSSPTQDVDKAVAILIHGDAAFPGQGIVSETLNLANINGYSTGGTIHIIANNKIGFTTDSADSRSTTYASDPAKGYKIPIIHVNADDPEACMRAIDIAWKYRSTFHKDILIDVIGYRRYGHNEMDDPAVTQPHIYKLVANHPTVHHIYAQTLLTDSIVSTEKIKEINQTILSHLQSSYQEVLALKDKKNNEGSIPSFTRNDLPIINTGVPIQTLTKINNELISLPNNFSPYPKLKKILERRKLAFENDKKIEWALAEELAFATILQDGIPIRLSGQDSQRGTFAHRHIMLHDTESNELISPIHQVSDTKASFAVHNSPLSESAVIGYEYGYNLFSPETLTIWEAQYGDFANTAQTFFDQFISAGRAKWNQKSGLVLLLPHGYEGQGAEHSSARLERFLQMSAEHNWTIANVTTSAQYFHLLRRQAAILRTEYARPLILFTPKSLLRQSAIASTPEELTIGAFKKVLEQSSDYQNVKRIIFSTGKIAIDLIAELENRNSVDREKIRIIRIEQLYPFPKEEISTILALCRSIEEVVWVQEEPKNMGAWQYISSKLTNLLSINQQLEYVGRSIQSAPAVGNPTTHKLEQGNIITQALEIKNLVKY